MDDKLTAPEAVNNMDDKLEWYKYFNHMDDKLAALFSISQSHGRQAGPGSAAHSATSPLLCIFNHMDDKLEQWLQELPGMDDTLVALHMSYL